MALLNGAGAGFVTKIPHLVHLRGHALQQCSMAVFNPQFQRTRYQGRHGSNARAWSMNIQDALDLSLNEEAFRIIGKKAGPVVREFSEKGIFPSIATSEFFSNQPRGHRRQRNPKRYFLRETRLGRIVENYDRPRIHDE